MKACLTRYIADRREQGLDDEDDDDSSGLFKWILGEGEEYLPDTSTTRTGDMITEFDFVVLEKLCGMLESIKSVTLKVE